VFSAGSFLSVSAVASARLQTPSAMAHFIAMFTLADFAKYCFHLQTKRLPVAFFLSPFEGGKFLLEIKNYLNFLLKYT
jgi:hypothetical protein